jgi:Cys-rich protein (TIGR01571 family)
MMVPFLPVVVATELTPLAGATGGGFEGTNTPHGRWKDGLFDCCKFGVFHPSVILACCVPQILMAQVLTRLKMNLWGDAAPEHEYKVTFRRMIILVISFWILSSILDPPGPEFEAHEDGTMRVTHPHCSWWQRSLYHLVTTLFYLYSLILLIKLRSAVRRHHEIPEKDCAGMEDCCCAFWCGCCTVAQIARQTADYDQRRAECCSPTGLPALSSAIIV